MCCSKGVLKLQKYFWIQSYCRDVSPLLNIFCLLVQLACSHFMQQNQAIGRDALSCTSLHLILMIWAVLQIWSKDLNVPRARCLLPSEQPWLVLDIKVNQTKIQLIWIHACEHVSFPETQPVGVEQFALNNTILNDARFDFQGIGMTPTKCASKDWGLCVVKHVAKGTF